MKRISFFVIASIFTLTACQQKKYGGFTVTGVIKNATNSKIFLQELPYGGQEPIILDSGKIEKDNKFSLKGIAREEGLYRLVIENGPDVLIVNDNDVIEVEMDVNNYRAYKIIGSKASESLHKLFENYRKQDSSLYLTFNKIDTLQKKPGNDSLLTIAKSERESQIKNINNSVRNFIKESNSPAARYYALGMASRTLNTDELKVLVNESADKFKEHSGLQKIKIALNATSNQKTPEPVAYPLLNKLAPAINLADTNGKMISLANFKGKYVLVDFWASWCGPCRRENPNVVATYNQFKNKNFTILGVSMDEDKSAWLEAIKADQLSWTQVSILADWNSHPLTQEYQFNAIPFNVLIDPTGKIIAADLRGADLMNKLAEVLK
jgi:peroxiredoxin